MVLYLLEGTFIFVRQKDICSQKHLHMCKTKKRAGCYFYIKRIANNSKVEVGKMFYFMVHFDYDRHKVHPIILQVFMSLPTQIFIHGRHHLHHSPDPNHLCIFIITIYIEWFRKCGREGTCQMWGNWVVLNT